MSRSNRSSTAISTFRFVDVSTFPDPSQLIPANPMYFSFHRPTSIHPNRTGATAIAITGQKTQNAYHPTPRVAKQTLVPSDPRTLGPSDPESLGP